MQHLLAALALRLRPVRNRGERFVADGERQHRIQLVTHRARLIADGNGPIGWVTETTKSQKPWKAYNDAATGAQPGRAPTLMRTMADGSKRPVKFDGIQGDYVIDRKWKVVDAPHARAQLLRQSEVLAEHRLIGTWEVPTPAQKGKALKLFRKMKVTNIHVKVVKP